MWTVKTWQTKIKKNFTKLVIYKFVENFESEVSQRSISACIELPDPCDRNPPDISKEKLQAEEINSYSSIQTDISDSASIASKKSENSYSDNNNSIKSRNVLVRLRKISQNDNLDKLQPTKESSDPTSVCGLLTIIFFYLLFCSLKLQ